MRTNVSLFLSFVSTKTLDFDDICFVTFKTVDIVVFDCGAVQIIKKEFMISVLGFVLSAWSAVIVLSAGLHATPVIGGSPVIGQSLEVLKWRRLDSHWRC